MGFYGFGLGTSRDPEKAKKFFGQRSGLFGRTINDDIKSRHKGHGEPKFNDTERISVYDRNKKIFYRNIPESIIRIFTIVFLILLIISIIIFVFLR